MKRDMDLVREILLAVEEAEDLVSVDRFKSPTRNLELVGYNVQIMIDAGLIKGKVQYADNAVYSGLISGLIWEGQDYLDAVRNDEVWRKTKDAIKKSTGSATFDVIKAVAAAIAQKLILSAAGLG